MEDKLKELKKEYDTMLKAQIETTKTITWVCKHVINYI